MTGTGLMADIVACRESFALNARFALAGGETVAVVGPNGAGKTTLLQALAGLVPLTRGTVRLDGRLLDDPVAGVALAPEDRQVGVVFQDLLLFPHLSALDNVAYGLRRRGRRRAGARAVARQWLARLGLDSLDGRRPGQLSGGQCQRVALARALAPEPRLLLLDEPLSALDASARPAARDLLAACLADFAGVAIVVTHDPAEATALADRLLVMEGGRIVQDGTAADLAARPATPYVADLMPAGPAPAGPRTGDT